MKLFRFNALVSGPVLCLLAVLSGCGWGGTPPTFPTTPDFTITVSPPTVSMLPGAPAQAFNLQIAAQNSFSGTVSVQAAFSAANLACVETACTTSIQAPGSSSLHLASLAAAVPGSYTITFTATSGSLVHTATSTLTVTLPPTPDFGFSVSPLTTSLTAGVNTPAYSFSLTPLAGFSAPVTITASAPSGFTCLQNPCSIATPAVQLNNAMQFSTSSSVPAGTYTITFTATSGSLVHTATSTLTLAAAPVPDFTFSVSPSTTSLVAGSNTPAFSFTLAPVNGFASNITITASAPSGFTCLQSPCSLSTPAVQVNNALQFSTLVSLAPASYTITFTATSGSLVHTATATLTVTAPPPTPDFSFTVSPVSSLLTAGSNTSAYSFAITPVNGFSAAISITASAPTGFTCLQAPCSVTSSATQILDALQFSSVSTLASAGYTITFTATSGSLVHTATATLIVSPPVVTTVPCGANPLVPTTPAAGSTAFIYTGDALPRAAVYDSLHNVIFATNYELGEVDVLSPNTLSVLSRIPVSQPEGLDLSADFSTLIVGTDTNYFYRINTTTLCVIDRPFMAGANDIPGIYYLNPITPYSLADGSIVFQLSRSDTGEAGLVRWTAAGGATAFGGNNPEFITNNSLVVSGDHQHLFMGIGGGYATSNALVRYDVATAKFTTVPVNTYNGSQVLATNYDGSRVYLNNYGSIAVTDSSFNVLNSVSNTAASATDGGYAYSPSASRLFATVNYYSSIEVLDASNLNVLGYLPPQYLAQYPPANSLGSASINSTDGIGRLLVRAVGGVILLDLSAVPQPSVTAAAIIPGNLTGDNILYSPSITLGYSVDGGSLNSGPGPTAAVSATGVNFAEGPTVLPAAFTTGTGPNDSPYITITPPSFSGGCADVTASFNVGIGAFFPRVFCFGPEVNLLYGDSGPSTGGGKFTLYGKALGNKPDVRIGGVPATMVSNPFYFPTTALEDSPVVFTAPAGTVGSAPITVSNGSGPAITLPWSYNYYSRLDAPIVSNAKPFQLVYDSIHSRLLWTDSTRNLLVVASPTTGQTLQEIPVGKQPWGLSLSPDGSKIAIANALDDAVAIYDSVSFSLIQSATLPASFFGFTPLYPAFMNNGKVIVGAGLTSAIYSGGSGPAAFFTMDLASNTVIDSVPVLGGATCVNIAEAAGASDGSHAVAGPYVYTSATNTFTAQPAGGCTQLAISGDGAVNATAGSFFDSLGRQQNFINPPYEIGTKEDNSFDSGNNSFISNVNLNSTGSLAIHESAISYPGTPSPTTLEVYDTQHGSLIRSFDIPGDTTYVFGSKQIAQDPAGQRIWMFTNAGLSILQFANDPLAIGEVKVSSGILTVLGSGFTPSMAISVDGVALPSVSVTGTIQATAPLPTLFSGTHSVTVTNAGTPPYSLPAAFTTP